MAQFGLLVAVLSLSVLSALANAQDTTPPPTPEVGYQICTLYTQGGTRLLDALKVFELMMMEFGKKIQTLTPVSTQRWITDMDDDHDQRLNLAECVKLVQTISDSIQGSAQPQP